jgi:hypothetical protein
VIVLWLNSLLQQTPVKRKDKSAKFQAERLICQAVWLAFANGKSFDR